MLGCAKSHLDYSMPDQQAAIFALKQDLVKLPQIKENLPYPRKEVEAEADLIAKALVNQTRETNKIFKMSGGPKWHNFLIHLGIRKRGFCYDWVPELLQALPPYPMKFFERHWGGSFLSLGRENNAVIVTKRGASLESGMVYDAWRGVGQPFWVLVGQDKKYSWTERFTETEILLGKAKVEPK